MINSIHLPVSNGPLNQILAVIDESYGESLSQEIAVACQNLDIPAVKELLKKGACYDQTIELNLGNLGKFCSQIKDVDCLYLIMINFLEEVFEEVRNQTQSEIAINAVDILENFLLEGGRFSESFIPKLLELVQEIADVLTSSSFLKDLAVEEPLIEAAFNLRDLELIQLLVANGCDLSSYDLKENCLLDHEMFTKTAAEIVEYLMEQRIALESLLDEDETLLDLLEEAQESNNRLLVAFLIKHGVGEENLKLQPNVIAC